MPLGLTAQIATSTAREKTKSFIVKFKVRLDVKKQGVGLQLMAQSFNCFTFYTIAKTIRLKRSHYL